MPHDWTIRPELQDDLSALDNLHRRAFGPSHPIPELIAALRALQAPFASVSLVAADSGNNPIGHIMVSHAWLDAPRRLLDVAVLSPLGVDPEFQRMGVGTALIEGAIDSARGLNVPLAFLEGSPRYYGKRGFKAATPLGFRAPSLRIPEPAFQVARLPGYTAEMRGTLVYREPFWRLDCVGLRQEA